MIRSFSRASLFIWMALKAVLRLETNLERRAKSSLGESSATRLRSKLIGA